MSFKDGDFTTAAQNWPRVPSLPFANYSTPDLYAWMFERDMVVLSANWTLTTGQRTSITNLFTFSQDDENAAWTKSELTVVADSVANPMDGATTANSLMETVTNAEHTIAQAAVITANPVVFYRVLKANGRDWARLKITDSAATVKTAFFNLSTGVVGTVSSGATSGIVPVPGATGWYLCWMVFTAPASGSATFLAQPSTDGSTVSYAGDVTKGLYAFAAQAEQASAYHAYIHTTTVSRTGSAPNLEINEAQEGSDPFAFVVYEDPKPQIEKVVAHYTRRHARVPKQQTTFPGSRYIPIPSVVNTIGDGASVPVLQIDPMILYIGEGVFNEDVGAIFVNSTSYVYGVTQEPSARVVGYATAGTFTLTFGANTTAALNYNDSGATIAAAINGLASIISAGLTATVTNGLTLTTGGSLLIIWTVGTTLDKVTMNAGSMTVTTSQNPTTQVATSTNQSILLPDHYTFSPHGFDPSLELATLNQLTSTGAYRILLNSTGAWGVIDANTIWLPTAGTPSTYINAATFSSTLPSGQTILLRTKTLETYYLPGVTLGIDTPADIPVPADLQQNNAFVSAILNQSGYATYQSEGPQPWMDSLIYVVREVQINLDDINGS